MQFQTQGNKVLKFFRRAQNFLFDWFFKRDRCAQIRVFNIQMFYEEQEDEEQIY